MLHLGPSKYRMKRVEVVSKSAVKRSFQDTDESCTTTSTTTTTTTTSTAAAAAAKEAHCQLCFQPIVRSLTQLDVM